MVSLSNHVANEVEYTSGNQLDEIATPVSSTGSPVGWFGLTKWVRVSY